MRSRFRIACLVIAATSASCALISCVGELTGDEANPLGNPDGTVAGVSLALVTALPNSLDFGTTLTEQRVLLRTLDTQPLAFNVTPSDSWITTAAPGGTIIGGWAWTMVRVNRAGLADGEYAGSLTINIEGQPALQVPVKMTASAAAQDANSSLYLSSSQLNFGLTAVRRTLLIRNLAGGTAAFSISSDVPWISAEPASGENSGQSQSITITADRTGLDPGAYTGVLRVQMGDTVREVALTLAVGDPNDDNLPPILELSKSVLNFETNFTKRSFLLRNTGSGDFTWTATSGAGWATVSPASGDNSGEYDVLTVKVDRSGLPLGIHETVIEVTTNVGLVETVAVVAEQPTAQSNQAAHLIAGVVTADGQPLANVGIQASNGGSSTTTDEFGQYEIDVPEGWSGAVSATHAEYGFQPESYVYENVDSDYTGQDFAGSLAAMLIPGLKVHFANGAVVEYAGATEFDDALLRVRMQHEGNGLWALTLTNKSNSNIREVWFPWVAEIPAMNGDADDDILYHPRNFGSAKRRVIPMTVGQGQTQTVDWYVDTYPGAVFAPILVVADSREALGIAAANWPPKNVSLPVSTTQMGIRYDVNTLPLGTHQYRSFYCRSTGNAGAGVVPWHLVVDPYKAWLKAGMAEHGLRPNYPPEMRRVNGWISWQLQNMAAFHAGQLQFAWEVFGDRLQWIQCWGQMSNYYGPAGVYDPTNAVPPLLPGEEVGCCLDIPQMHMRYVPELVQFQNQVISQGGLFGYYTRPKSPYGVLTTPNSPHLQFLLNWNQSLAELGANAHYLDVVGGAYDLGNLVSVAEILRDRFPPTTVVEFAKDVFPTGFLISGSLWGGWDWETDPDLPQTILGTPQFQKGTCLQFGRYVMDDRIVFLGGCNGDHVFWGVVTQKGYYTERTAFLLGAKFDVLDNRIAEQVSQPTTLNIAVDAAIQAWDSVGWWDREPEYRDRSGISNVSAGIDVRRFVDKNGVNLFAVDNWSKLANRRFTFQGQVIQVPQQQRLSVLEVP